MTALVGGYRPLASLGQGGMCDVLLAAKDSARVDFTKLVVIKSLREEHARDPEFVRMFLDEARIAARLNHPNVIHTLDVGEDGQDYFLTMEYLDGQPLNRVMLLREPMPLGMRLTVLSDVLTGIHYAHELRDFDGTPLHIVHRDVTPHNVFVTYDGQVKVMDFGIARAAGRATQTKHGVIKGKVNYMAPEQVLASRTVDRRVDVFAVGIMLYEACSQTRMWEGAPSKWILKSLVRGEHPKSPRERDVSVHPELDRICRKALGASPADRYPTAEAMREDLDAFLANHGPRPSNRQIGAFVAGSFAAQRRRASSILEKQLAELLEGPRPVVSMGLEGSEPREPTVEITATPSEGASTGPPGARPRARSRVHPTWGLALAALAIGSVGAWKLEGPIAAWSRGSARAVPAMLTLTLHATPVEAVFRIDEGPPVANPYVARLPADHQAHSIRASAPGFAEDVKQIVFDHDVSIRFALVHPPLRDTQ